jgi:hypothetical protein
LRRGAQFVSYFDFKWCSGFRDNNESAKSKQIMMMEAEWSQKRKLLLRCILPDDLIFPQGIETSTYCYDFMVICRQDFQKFTISIYCFNAENSIKKKDVNS